MLKEFKEFIARENVVDLASYHRLCRLPGREIH